MAKYTTKNVRINVTKKDILLGEPNCIKRCPIARAALRKFKTVRVEEEYIYLDRKRYYMPERIQHFIYIYDNSDNDERKTMKPFSFSLEIREYI